MYIEVEKLLLLREEEKEEPRAEDVCLAPIVL